MSSTKKILFVNLPYAINHSYSQGGTAYPSTSILLIASVLKRAGYEVNIIDGALDEDYLEQVSAALSSDDDILYVGLSVMTTQIPFALEVSKLVKLLRSSQVIVWGGPHPTLFPEQTLRNEFVDAIVVNEGSKAAVQIADALEMGKNLEGIEGIGYKDYRNAIKLQVGKCYDRIDKLPHFDFSLIDVKRYISPSNGSIYAREFPHVRGEFRIMPILTGLGCPYKCEFCINVILGRKYRFRTAESVVGEIKRLMKVYRANTFLFLDEDFFISKRRLFEFLDLVERERMHFNWRTWCRVDHFNADYLNADVLRRIERVGAVSIAMGGESASQEMLDSLKKDIRVEDIERSLEFLRGSQIFPRYSFMVGLENESYEQIKKTYQFCVEMKRKVPGVDIAGPFVFRLYPGSPIYDRITRGYKLPTPTSLDEWDVYLRDETTFTSMPWVPERFKKVMRTAQVFSELALSYTGRSKNPFKRFVKGLLLKSARCRLRYLMFSWPIELRFIQTLSLLRGIS